MNIPVLNNQLLSAEQSAQLRTNIATATHRIMKGDEVRMKNPNDLTDVVVLRKPIEVEPFIKEHSHWDGYIFNNRFFEGVKSPSASAVEPPASKVVPLKTQPAIEATQPNAAASTPGKIKATPFVWCDPHLIPPREWLYGRHLIRKFTSGTVAPGGVGKSSLVLVEAIAMATGRDLLKTGHNGAERLRVWCWNGEDPTDETKRRIAAICLHYGIDGRTLFDYLFVDSGRDMPIEIATEDKSGSKIAIPIVEEIIHEVRHRKIDVLIIDPFVSSHSVNENDNSKIDMVMKKGWGAIAEATNIAIELVHHVRKSAHGQFEHTIDDGRGASAFKDASRSARILNVMSKDEAKNFGVGKERRSYFRSDDGKGNMVKQSDHATWYYLDSVELGNHTNKRPSDDVAVVTRWTPPNPFDGVTSKHLSEIMKRVDQGDYRKDSQAKAWVGKLVAEVLGLNLADEISKNRVKGLVKEWLKTGALKEIEGKDSHGEDRTFVKAGQIIDLKASAP